MHSIIPHHHHDEVKITQQGGTNDDDHEDIDHNFLAHSFAFFHHDQGGIILYESASPTFQCCKVNIDKEMMLLVQHFISLIEKPPLIHAEHYLFCSISSHYSVNKRFRGPPSVMA